MSLPNSAPPYRRARDLTPAELDALEGRQLPRIGTPRTPGRRTMGSAMTGLDGLDGLEFMPWQTHIADVSLEVDGRTDRWAAREVALVLSRQTGKTTVLARRIVAGLFILGDHTILHTAQDRAMPRETFTEVAEMVEEIPDLRKYRKTVRWSNGTEYLELVDGSTYRILAPTQQAFRGWKKCGLLIVDEAREHRDRAVLSAALYTQATHPNPQLWIASNAGDPDSEVLNGYRDRGRAGEEGLAYFEWSAPDEAEVDDVDGWIQANPSLGYTMRGGSILEELRTDDPNSFRTERLCQWVDVTTRHAIDAAEWLECGDRDLEPVPTDGTVPIFLALDMDGDRRAAALLAGAWVSDRLVVQLVDEWTSTVHRGVVKSEQVVSESAIAERVAEFAASFPVRGIGYDPNTCGGVVNRLENRGLPFERVAGTDWVVACSQLDDAISNRQLAHPDQPSLNRQIAKAGRRDVGDGTWRMSRLDSDIPIPAAIALARLVYVASSPDGSVGITVIG